MTVSPRVAVVMPYYNEPELLKRSVEGVMKQTYYNWKLFIVDDGSSKENRADHTIVQNYQIKIINKPNSGVSDARNRALDHIQAEGGFTHIAYCDSDDIWKDMHLKESLRVLDSHKADMTYSTPEFRMVDGELAIPYGIPLYESYPGIDTLIKQNFIYISSVIHKTECCNLGGFDRELNSLEDWDMWLRIAEAGYYIKQGLFKTPSLIYTCKPAGNGSRRTEDIYQKVLTKHAITNNTNS
ncbi:MAG: glycosyltransferase [Cytophagia bacterium]|jgi:glycosyltransferase involved in cell wall biosynthesis|nr:glycosyltransferase [Cytophagia bacterium]